jgi:hypothetical protein
MWAETKTEKDLIATSVAPLTILAITVSSMIGLRHMSRHFKAKTQGYNIDV